MSDQEQTRAPQPAEEVAEAPAPKATDSTLADGLDDILDEIDEVLETNAEEFVKSYVQKGGE
ncbi:MAG: ubiquitin-like protein Pup [Actinomycetota bacterium]